MLVSSDDMRKLNSSRARWISLLVPDLGLRGLPVDWLEHEMAHVYQVMLERNGYAWQVVGLVNWNDHSQGCWLRFAELGYQPGVPFHIFELWTKRYWRITASEMDFPNVPPHGCRLVRICQVGAAPQLVGDTLHISQGAEISSMVVENGKVVVETIDLCRKADGELWFALPGKPLTATCNGDQVSIEEKAEGVYAVHLKFMGRGRLELVL